VVLGVGLGLIGISKFLPGGESGAADSSWYAWLAPFIGIVELLASIALLTRVFAWHGAVVAGCLGAGFLTLQILEGYSGSVGGACGCIGNYKLGVVEHMLIASTILAMSGLRLCLTDRPSDPPVHRSA